MSELMMSSPHNFPFILYTEMTKISYFSYENVRLALITLWIDANIVNTNISWYEGHNYQKFGQKIKIFKILCTKYMASSEAMTSSTHSFAYSYGLVKKCFLNICETWKCHNFLICQPIFIRFSLFCSENFTLSSEIKLDQLRTSPLKRMWNTGLSEVCDERDINHTIEFLKLKFISFIIKNIMTSWMRIYMDINNIHTKQ